MSYYNELINDSLDKKESDPKNRFISITEREDFSDIPKMTWAPLLANSYIQTWKSVILNKGPLEIAIYPMLLYELRPQTIIELGALNGGSAIWLADLLESFAIKCSIYSLDIELSLLHEKAKTDKRIHFLQGDCNNLRASLSPQFLAKLPHPWLIIEDAHVNLTGVLEYFHSNGLQSKDYLIVEDTNIYMWEYWKENGGDKKEVQSGLRKLTDLRHWLLSHPDEYLIDTHYQDMFGKNGSKCWNSILKKQ